MNLIQRHPYLLAAVLAAFLLTVATPLVAADPNCSAACVKRVEAREFAAKHGGCRSMVCVGRVEEKRWRHARWKLPAAITARLARLRWCESRNDYRATNGSHWGAYQYAWGFAGSAGERAGFKVRPDLASPDEQDVRTAAWFPSHAREWACHA